MENLNLIVKLEFGSKLYGTNNENSDTDFKGIFIPSKKDLYLQKVKKSIVYKTNKSNDKNNNEDIDSEYYSLNYFLKLACKGETAALDMLHTPQKNIISSSYIWNDLVSKRSFFYTKQLKSFIGYARRQASKYGLKGSRLNNVKKVIDILNNFDPAQKLHTIWDHLPDDEHLFKFNDLNIREYQVCGRKIQETVLISYALNILNNFYKTYGKRAELAAQNKGIDWKAISHALRAAYQTREILQNKTITFPLKEAEFLKKVKTGKLNYKDEVIPVLEDLMIEVEELSLKSDLPEKVNIDFWNEWLFKTLENIN